VARVLVVDDDESIRDFVSLALSEEGYEVMTAAHGAAALTC
jgi:DNA-binding response OmpR family regulator